MSPWLQRLQGYISKLKNLQLVATFDNAIDAVEYLHTHTVDLMFLDIEMDELSGIELLENVKFTGQIIITTAYDSYALKGYELNVTDYLLKPYTFERFLKAIDKVLMNKKTPENSNSIFIKTENRLVQVPLDSILFIEGMGDYRRIHCTDKRIMTLELFNELERRLDSSKICRVHKSYMVSISKIESVERNRITVKGSHIPISNTYQKEFFQLIKNNDV